MTVSDEVPYLTVSDGVLYLTLSVRAPYQTKSKPSRTIMSKTGPYLAAVPRCHRNGPRLTVSVIGSCLKEMLWRPSPSLETAIMASMQRLGGRDSHSLVQLPSAAFHGHKLHQIACQEEEDLGEDKHQTKTNFFTTEKSRT